MLTRESLEKIKNLESLLRVCYGIHSDYLSVDDQIAPKQIAKDIGFKASETEIMFYLFVKQG